MRPIWIFAVLGLSLTVIFSLGATVGATVTMYAAVATDWWHAIASARE